MSEVAVFQPWMGQSLGVHWGPFVVALLHSKINKNVLQCCCKVVVRIRKVIV